MVRRLESPQPRRKRSFRSVLAAKNRPCRVPPGARTAASFPPNGPCRVPPGTRTARVLSPKPGRASPPEPAPPVLFPPNRAARVPPEPAPPLALPKTAILARPKRHNAELTPPEADKRAPVPASHKACGSGANRRRRWPGAVRVAAGARDEERSQDGESDERGSVDFSTREKSTATPPPPAPPPAPHQPKPTARPHKRG